MLKKKKKVTLIDKANVLDTSRLWRKSGARYCEKIIRCYIRILFVDNAAMQMILNPKQFDVILTENMFGDIISDEASVIGGSIGFILRLLLVMIVPFRANSRVSYPQAKEKELPILLHLF